MSHIEPGGYAESKWLEMGDQILAVNGDAVGNLQEFENTLNQIKKGGSIFLLIISKQSMRLFHYFKTKHNC